jgi:hypothetical protein
MIFKNRLMCGQRTRLCPRSSGEFLRISPWPENARPSSLLNTLHVWKIQNAQFVLISQKRSIVKNLHISA